MQELITLAPVSIAVALWVIVLILWIQMAVNMESDERFQTELRYQWMQNNTRDQTYYDAWLISNGAEVSKLRELTRPEIQELIASRELKKKCQTKQ